MLWWNLVTVFTVSIFPSYSAIPREWGAFTENHVLRTGTVLNLYCQYPNAYAKALFGLAVQRKYLDELLALGT